MNSYPNVSFSKPSRATAYMVASDNGILPPIVRVNLGWVSNEPDMKIMCLGKGCYFGKHCTDRQMLFPITLLDEIVGINDQPSYSHS